jgi:serine/threonine-protein kinase
MPPSTAQARWLRLSPLLDELLDLEPAARAARLAELRADDPAGADELQAMLDELPAIEREEFLERPALFAEASMAGQQIGPYTVERELGEGGMGSVWLARRTDGRYEGFVAVKFLNAALLARGGAERFAREGSILARLAHPHIARLIDAGVAKEGRQPYLVLEYIDGLPIDRYCSEHELPLAERVRLFLDVLSAVAHAHNRLILHRDLKPSNILVTAAGEAKLLDFGIAKLLDDSGAPAEATELTQRAGRAFTPHYAAPEQLQGGEVTTATDVYALGVLLYVLLGGEHPTAGRTVGTLDQMRAVVELEPRRLSEAVARRGGPNAQKLARELRGDLDNIVAKALKKAPTQRYANAAAFADDLQRTLNHEPVSARPDTAAYRIGKFVRRHRLGVAAGTLAASAIVVGVTLALWQAREAQRQRVQAEGLIEFMLGDLRKKLQPVGRLDALDAVGEKALGYYAQQERGAMNADALGRKARALHLIGEIAEQRGRLEDAAKVFEQAAQSTATLLARDPGNAQRIFDHSQSVYWVGYVAWRRNQWTQAQQEFEQYQGLAERLVRVAPDKSEWRPEPAYAAINLGVALLEDGRAAEALRSFERGRDGMQALVKDQPDLRFSLGNAWGWVAKAREAQGDLAGALRAQRTKIDVLTQAPDVARNSRAQNLIAIGELELGRLHLALGRYGEARETLQTALAHFERQGALDASNIEWRAETTIARLSLIESLLAAHLSDEAAQQLARAEREVPVLLAADKAKQDWQIRLPAWVLMLRAEAGRPALARAEIDACFERVRRFEAGGGHTDQEQTRVIAAAELAAGDWLQPEDEAVARRHWLAAIDRLQAPAARGELPALTLKALALWRLGRIDEARAIASRLKSSPYRHPAYADLEKRLAAAEGAAAVH